MAEVLERVTFLPIVNKPRMLHAAVDRFGNVYLYVSPVIDLLEDPIAAPVRDALSGRCYALTAIVQEDDPNMWFGIGEYLAFRTWSTCPGDVPHICTKKEI